MKKKDTLQLKQVGDQHLLIDVLDAELPVVDVYNLNGTAAWLWQNLEHATSASEFAALMCQAYDIDPTVAAKDIESQLQEWTQLGIITKK
ncbi:MAG: PqqD family protein [Bacteroidales bacterium]|nr:PqqD family protein [Bacteroidales bacterium]